MSKVQRWALPDNILGRTILLAIGLVLLLTAINVGIIFLRPPPRDMPLTSYEVARLLTGEPIAKEASGLVQMPAGITVVPTSETDRLIGAAIARHLRVPVQAVRFQRTYLLPEGLMHLDEQVSREAQLYPASEFDPIVFNAFAVTARLSDGTMKSLVREGRDPGWSWQLNTALRLLLAFFLVLPLAWWFARALAQPIRSFASSVDRVGREPGVAPVEVRGPSEIRLAAQAVNDMQGRLQRYLNERTGVVGAIAHDLRTPLSRLRFHLNDASDAVRFRGEAEIAEMEAMIAATMDFVQHETRPRISEPIDLALLVEGIVDDHADIGRNVELEQAEPVTVRGDALLLKRLFNNLIANAVTYGNEARVRVDRRGPKAVVTISDRGPGMSSKDIERAFEPFYRAESSRNRQTGGIGLGLAIVRGAAQAHGGEVRLTNAKSGGLAAEVLLPLA